MFENYDYESQERGKKLRIVTKTLRMFVLAGTLLLGSEPGLHANSHEDSESYYLTKVMELVDEEHRELFLKIIKDRVKKPILIESSIPSREKDITISEIRKYLATLPRGWIDGEIASIKTATDKDELYAVLPESVATFHSDSGKIFFSQDISKESERGYIFYSLGHEIGHGNDIFTDMNITWKERYSLYKKLKGRVESDNRFRTNFLLGVEEKFYKGDIDLTLVVREYWAEICAQYMSDPTQLHIDDFELVHEFVIKNDPDYKWREKLRERVKIQGEFKSPQIVKEK